MKKAKKVTKVKAKKRGPNTLFPGKANYVGPQGGWFAFLHHAIMFETAEYSGVNERIAYIKNHKPSREVRVRLRHVIYLGEALNKRINDWNNKMPGRPIYDPEIKRAVMAYARRHIKDLRWDRKKCSLCHADGRKFTG